MTDRLAVELRRIALDRMDESQIAALLARVPALADALQGRGHLAPRRIEPRQGWVPFAPPATREVLATILASSSGIHAVLCTLNVLQLRLLGLASFRDGILHREDIIRELDEDALPAVHEAARDMAGLSLGAVPDDDHPSDTVIFIPFPLVAEHVGLPGIPFAGDNAPDFTSARLAIALELLGHAAPDLTRKADRAERLLWILRDRDHIDAVRQQMPVEVADLFRHLVEYDNVTLSELGLNWYAADPRNRPPYLQSPLTWLTDRGLAWADPYDDHVWVWLEVKTAMGGGRLYGDWMLGPPDSSPVPVDDPGPFLPSVLVTFESLLDQLATSPAEGLKSGGIGVRATKALAKNLQVPPTTVAVLLHLALELGLVGSLPIGKATGRGRARSQPMGWAPTSRRTAWSALPAAARWSHLVEAWIDARELDESEDGLPNKVAVDEYRIHWQDKPYLRTLRRDVLATLVGLPPGTGLTEHELFTLFHWLRPATVHPVPAAGALAVARVLGLVPADGPIGLTVIARQIVTTPEQVTAAVQTRAGALMVQADLTVMVPPETAPEVAARIVRYGTVEGDAAVRIVRLGRAQVAAALAAGETADEVIEFLDTHSRTDLPDTVTHLVQDLARNQGRLRAGSATSYLRSDDTALIASAAGVAGAKLRVLAPTVAVSSLTRAKLVEVLQDAGLPLVAEQTDGADVAMTTHVAEPRHATANTLDRVRTVLPQPTGLAALATDLFQTVGTPVEVDPRGHWKTEGLV